MSFIATGITAGLTALGVGATAAGVAGTVGAGALIGSGLGAATSAISGGDPGKGALFGALGGVATGGIGSLLGAGSGAAGAVAEGASEIAAPVTNTGSAAVNAALSESPTAITSQGIGTAANLPTIPAGVATPAATAAPVTSSPTALGGGFTGFGNVGDFLAKEVGTKALTEGIGGINQSVANAKTEKESDKIKQDYFSGWAHGGDVQHVAREGGSIRLKNGDFIIPADVVSALGNGSSKAGAKYLTHLMRALDAGPAPKAGSLAKQRTQKRHAA